MEHNIIHPPHFSMQNEQNQPTAIQRRALLASLPMAAATAATWSSLSSADAADKTSAEFRLDSPPVLQNPTPDGMTVAWAINGRGTGWVEYGFRADLLEHRAVSSNCGLLAMTDRFMSARISGLKPGQKVFYRACSARIYFTDAYDIQRGKTIASPVYQFATPNPTAETASFAIINDTHENPDTLKKLTATLAENPEEYLIWNGDVFNDVQSEDQVVQEVLRPADAAYAATRPVLFTSGNHDVRGAESRLLPNAFTPWTIEEPLSRCFAVRQGPLAIIGLDTGEDKPDVRPVYAGLADFEQYRRDQRDWLARAFKRPEIAAAPFLIICCHIPLNGLPGQNGGDTPVDFARYSKQSRELWGPLIESARAQLVISGHTHEYRYDAPTVERPWGQLVGGGPRIKHATIIRGRATGKQLTVALYNLNGKKLGEWTYEPRNA
jgi:acid phosphatase type 7